MTSDDLKNKAKDMADQAGRSAQNTSESVKSAAYDAQGSAQNAASGLGEKARVMADQASDTASDLYGRVSKAAGSLPDSASDAMAKGQRVFESGSSQVVSQVKKQPLEALLLAGAIGYLVGWATNRG